MDGCFMYLIERTGAVPLLELKQNHSTKKLVLLRLFMVFSVPLKILRKI